MVIVTSLDFNSICPHHLLPINGVAHIAFIPNGKVFGLSKYQRFLNEMSKIPMKQEDISLKVVEGLQEVGKP